MEITRLPDESPEYAAAREKLRIAELELVQQRERVAEMRRALPSGTVVENYAFLDGSRTVRLRDLFTAPDRALIALSSSREPAVFFCARSQRTDRFHTA